jgi:hypothetical protein
VSTFIPAFATTKTSADGQTVKDGAAVVPYSVSPYNETSKIKRVHVCVTDQKTNDNALNNSNGVYVSDFLYDEDLGSYYVSIPSSAMKNAKFKTNQYYKVQLRFDLNDTMTGVSGDANDIKNTTALGTYLISGRDGFSEWSSVCLVRAISEPTLVMVGLDYTDSDLPPGFNIGVIPVSGHLTFSDSSETETLESFQLQVLDKDAENVLVDTGTVYTGGNFDTNTISYKLDTSGVDISESQDFVLRVTYTTDNQYSDSKDYDFQIYDNVEDEFFQPTVTAVADADDGIVTVTIKNTRSVFGVLYVKRASSRDGYKEWEDVYVTVVNDAIDMTVTDNTVCSLVYYRYSVQLENANGVMSQVVKSEKVLPDFYDCFLSRGSTQLGVRFNYNITSFKPVVSRTKVDTLGGKYPRFTENANMNYKQFSITGLISSEMDENERFMPKAASYLGVTTYADYTNYRKANRINDYEDYGWERMFRDEAVAWLNDGEPKLYRSQTEGNMCVMVTDVSLTPNQTLSRRLWEFSATVYEVADGYSMSDLDYLGIYDIHADGKGGDGSSHGGSCADTVDSSSAREYTEIERVAQSYQVTVTDNYDFVANVISPLLQMEYTGIQSGRTPESVTLRNLRIFFHNQPHIYLQSADGSLTRVTREVFDANQDKQDQFVFGYRFELNRKNRPGSTTEYIFVNSGGLYVVPDEVEVTDISFPDIDDDVSANYHVYEDSSRNETVTLDYILTYREYEDSTSSSVSAIRSSDDILGQVSGPFEVDQSVMELAGKKYSFSKPQEYYKKMSSWSGMSVDVTSHAVMALKYKDEDSYTTVEVGDTGIFHIMPDYDVDDMYFTGRRMYKQDLSRAGYLVDNQFVDTGESYSSIIDVTNYIANGVYSISGNSKIFYNGQWYDFTYEDSGNGLAAVPIEGTVNYICNVITVTIGGA